MQFLSGSTCSVGSGRRPLSSSSERKLGLRIFRMHQERCPPIDVGAQQAHAFVGRVPRLHHDVIQLIPEKLVDDTLVALLHFQEIGKHSYRRHAALKRVGLEKLAHGFGRVAVLVNHRLQRGALALKGGELGAHAVELPFAFGLGATLFFKLAARFGDLRRNRRSPSAAPIRIRS